MSEILFYHLERQTLEQALPLLLEACLKRGWRAVVQAGSKERVNALDSHLWDWRDGSFLPHAAAGDTRFSAHATMQPIWLTPTDEVPNEAQALFLVDGVVRDNIDGFKRCVFIFNGRDEEGVRTARAHWTRLKKAGHDLTYWQQNGDGKWQKNA